MAGRAQSAPAKKLRLKDVTVAVADTIHPDLAARALEICLDRCEFADAVLFSNVAVPGRFRSEPIAPLRSLNDYTRFCLQELPVRIATGSVLLVQWDGYVIDPSAWSPAFARFDYIGAVAPYVGPDGEEKRFVGNGGFSLRSRRLLDACPSLPVIADLNEDFIIGRTFREHLERDHGVRFAPEDIADRFSFEQRYDGRATFGFHGVFNLHRVESDEEVLRMLDRMTPAEWVDGRVFTLINQCLTDQRLALVTRLYERLRRTNTPQTLRAIVHRVYGSAEFAAAMIERLEGIASKERPAGA